MYLHSLLQGLMAARGFHQCHRASGRVCHDRSMLWLGSPRRVHYHIIIRAQASTSSTQVDEYETYEFLEVSGNRSLTCNSCLINISVNSAFSPKMNFASPYTSPLLMIDKADSDCQKCLC